MASKDITKCITYTCKKKNQCYRYTSEADEFMQSYSKFDEGLKEGEECEFFWDNIK